MITKAQTTTNHLNTPNSHRDCTSAQNEPNFKNTKLDTTSFLTRCYEDFYLYCCEKNEPNSNPIKANIFKNPKIFKKTLTFLYKSGRLLLIEEGGRYKFAFRRRITRVLNGWCFLKFVLVARKTLYRTALQ